MTLLCFLSRFSPNLKAKASIVRLVTGGGFSRLLVCFALSNAVLPEIESEKVNSHVPFKTVLGMCDLRLALFQFQP